MFGVCVCGSGDGAGAGGRCEYESASDNVSRSLFAIRCVIMIFSNFSFVRDSFPLVISCDFSHRPFVCVYFCVCVRLGSCGPCLHICLFIYLLFLQLAGQYPD